MVDIEKLKDTINDSGITIVALANKTNILRNTLYNKLSGKTEFTASEIESISDVLHLDSSDREAIFFAKAVEFK